MLKPLAALSCLVLTIATPQLAVATTAEQDGTICNDLAGCYGGRQICAQLILDVTGEDGIVFKVTRYCYQTAR